MVNSAGLGIFVPETCFYYYFSKVFSAIKKLGSREEGHDGGEVGG